MLLTLFAIQSLVCLAAAEVKLSNHAINAFLGAHNQLRKETAPCQDRSVNCKWWARIGECNRNARWMKPNCARSCGLCPCEPGCRNTRQMCQFWANIGECERNPAWMNIYCKMSCGRCLCGANMPLLHWSKKLASYAATRVNQCIYQHDPAKKYGENLYAISTQINDVTAAVKSSKAWGDEIKYVDDDWGCAFGKTPDTCGHYSQQIWNTTLRVGCAVNYCVHSAFTFTFVFCEYEPPGNKILYNMSTRKLTYFPPY